MLKSFWTAGLGAALLVLSACSGDDGGGETSCEGGCLLAPAAVCQGDELVSFTAPGTCTDGVCAFSESRITCDQGCAGGACVEADTTDLCRGVTCDAPPAASCDGQTAVTAAADGTCNAETGECSYETTRTDCAAAGQVCDAGACRAPGPCDGVTCDTPPAASCDGNSTVTYEPVGTCSGGTCDYQETTTPCGREATCTDGACVAIDRCEGVTCDAPPADTCRGNTLVVADATGTCEASSGSCTYGENLTDCAASGQICQRARCVEPPPDPCEVVVCNDPPEGSCDGTVATFYVGTCNARTLQCDYAVAPTVDCAATGQDCVAGSCVDRDLCAGVSCNAPPAPSCEGSISVIPTLPGTCTDGDCNFTVTRTNCASRGLICLDGFCQVEDPCTGVTCGAAPSARCAGDTAISYADAGACVDGECIYAETLENCAAGGGVCADGACDYSGSCDVSLCNAPPPGACEGTVAVTYPPIGSCGAGGSCVYGATRVDCGATPGGACEDASCYTVDACSGVVCNTPPAASCSGEVLTTYDSEGLCNPTSGACEYGFVTTNCLGNSATCQVNRCVADDPCQGVTCNDVPASVCVGSVAVSYALPGECAGGDCFYEELSEDCSLTSSICIGGVCTRLSPCDGVVCATPPDSVCEGNVAVQYTPTGICVDGGCTYGPNRVDCAADGGVCVSAACESVDLCAGVTCNAPPAPFCNGNERVTFASSGTCDAATGDCLYAATPFDCTENDEVCSGGACIAFDPCLGVVCPALPEPFCGGDFVYTYGAGVCVLGDCDYADSLIGIDCTLSGQTCAEGACVDPVASVLPGEVAINEILFAGLGGEQWIEVRNLTDRLIDLRGLTLSGDAGGSLFIDRPAYLAPQGYGVLSRTADIGNGETPLVVWGSSLDLAGQRTIGLYDGLGAVAELTLDGAWPPGVGTSVQLEPRSLLSRPTDLVAWCETTSSTGPAGSPSSTPNGTNDPCPGNIASALTITEIMLAPNESPAFAYQWFEVENLSSSTEDLTGLVVWFGVQPIAILGEGNSALAGERLVFGPTPGAAGASVDFVYGTATPLDPDLDSITLTMAGVTIDSVAWDTDDGWVVIPGASLSLAPGFEAANEFSSSWCIGVPTYGPGIDAGTPGQANNTCSP